MKFSYNQAKQNQFPTLFLLSEWIIKKFIFSQ